MTCPSDSLRPTPLTCDACIMQGRPKSREVKQHGSIKDIAKGVPCFLTLRGDVEKMARYICEDTGCALYDAVYAMLACCTTSDIYAQAQKLAFDTLKARHGDAYDARRYKRALPALHARRRAAEEAEAADAEEKRRLQVQVQKSRAKAKTAKLEA